MPATERLNEYRVMWIMVLYDLPTLTEIDRRNYTKFRKGMLKDGFSMFQFSAYMRHCASRENADVHIDRVKDMLPPYGEIGILTITDKQYSMMEVFRGRATTEKPNAVQQLELF